MNALFRPLTVGELELPNRIVMAPLTRARAGTERIPNDLMVEYYRQRAGAGLIISEATQISPQGTGWVESPGIHESAQVAGWQRVTRAVHEEGGRIFLQLWHMGRASHPDFQPGGALPVSASAIAISGEIRTPLGKKPHATPRALLTSEIPGVVEQYAAATRMAREAGFDGVEIHGANGYLLDQFLRDGSNQRTDEYGGSVPNRVRLLLEVTRGVVAAWSPGRVGVRISPTGPYNDMHDSDPAALFSYVAGQLDTFGLAYLHVMEALPGHIMAAPGPRVTPLIRSAFQGPLIVNGGYTQELGAQAIAAGEADLVAYGVPFIANPDLVDRFARGAALNPPDFETFYTPGKKGYTDYPVLTH